MKPILLAGLLLLSPVSGFSRTRAVVIDDSKEYAAAVWTPAGANLLDVKRYVAGSTIPIISASDGIDDRMGLINDVNGDGVINSDDITVANRNRWPFVVAESTVGEAYAWAGDSSAGLWGADTTTQFSIRLAKAGPNSWIAGKALENAVLSSLN